MLLEREGFEVGRFGSMSREEGGEAEVASKYLTEDGPGWEKGMMKFRAHQIAA